MKDTKEEAVLVTPGINSTGGQPFAVVGVPVENCGLEN